MHARHVFAALMALVGGLVGRSVGWLVGGLVSAVLIVGRTNRDTEDLCAAAVVRMIARGCRRGFAPTGCLLSFLNYRGQNEDDFIKICLRFSIFE